MADHSVIKAADDKLVVLTETLQLALAGEEYENVLNALGLALTMVAVDFSEKPADARRIIRDITRNANRNVGVLFQQAKDRQIEGAAHAFAEGGRA